ncbi:MAG: hypothetical protein AB8I08_04285 [Sandaracinaceae bacterium]
MHAEEAGDCRMAAQFIADAGTHPNVEVRVDRVELAPDAVDIELSLLFRAAHPVCCGEPSCYLPFLRPKGLASLAQDYQDQLGMLLAPRLRIVVTPSFEAGFRYLDEGIALDASPMAFP